MTNLNRLVIYSSMVFFFSCVNGMREKSSDDLDSYPIVSLSRPEAQPTITDFPVEPSRARRNRFKRINSLDDLNKKIMTNSEVIGITNVANYRAASDDPNRTLPAGICDSLLIDSEASDPQDFEGNQSLLFAEQYGISPDNFRGMVHSNSVDDFKLLENEFYESSTAVKSRENLSSQLDITKSTPNLLANIGQQRSLSSNLDITRSTPNLLANIKQQEEITFCASQKNFSDGKHEKFVSSKIRISRTTSMADFRSFEKEQKRANKKNRTNFELDTYGKNSPLVQEEGYVSRPMHRNTKVIVSIDGGGVRGIVPLTFLLAVQNEIFDKFQIPLTDFVDTFIGVSVGALVATSAVIQKMEYVSDNFCEIDKEVFTRNIWSRLTLGMRGAWYSSKGREKIFKDLLKDVDVANFKSRLLVPAYSNNTNDPVMFDSQNPTLDLFDILMGTSAASTYFEPHICKTTNGKTLQLIDPGMNKNSPALLAYKMMRAEYAYDRIILLSVGTGADRKVKSISEYPHWLPSFAWEFPNIVMDSAVRWDEWTMKYIEQMDPSLVYKRFQIALDKCITDSVDPMYIDTLKNATLTTINSSISPEYKRFNELIDLLSEVINERANM